MGQLQLYQQLAVSTTTTIDLSISYSQPFFSAIQVQLTASDGTQIYGFSSGSSYRGVITNSFKAESSLATGNYVLSTYLTTGGNYTFANPPASSLNVSFEAAPGIPESGAIGSVAALGLVMIRRQARL